MIFTDPIPFSDALDELRAKRLLPTGMSSAEIRTLDADVRLKSILSARTTLAQPLQGIKTLVDALLSGATNMATARAKMQDLYDALDYDSEAGGFPGDVGIPPAERGSLRDLSSDTRLDLVLSTNMRLVANRAYQRAGQTPEALYAFPAYELIRIYWRYTPRGFRRRAGELVEDPGTDWPSRWEAVGGSFYGDGRMIARKDDDVWAALGSSENFSDALDTDVPPFAFNSGYGIREVGRAECLALGVIGEADRIEGIPAQEAQAVASLAKFDDETINAAIKDLDVEIAAREAKLYGAKPAVLAALGKEVR